ncbi:phosphatidylinositol-glycan biosynthesis class F protein isoform X1 [Cucumis sativus]|uniref:phosphatidylinositol-glycan biosynthesis class F protein isoform X1 n=1 Tax=Cucumis sativus TaxID=3659 RepID=UPI0012F4B00B|nr:phosphatidylinositol-glycan biosynthesis class F protein isoform X1 [Cucumis sativus]
MEMEKKEMASTSSTPISIPEAFFLHLISALALALAFWIAHYIFSTHLISDPSLTLFLILVLLSIPFIFILLFHSTPCNFLSFFFFLPLQVVQSPIVILLYSRYRTDRHQCSYFKAVARGLLGLPAGAIINAFGAIVLGAPIGAQYFLKTLNWSLVMSLFNIVPSACVFGSSWIDWQRLFAYTKPIGTIDHMICIPAHGAIIGAWFGAWPMPLDWERPWQEWPICVTYGAILGYSIAMAASLVLSHQRGLQHVKRD